MGRRRDHDPRARSDEARVHEPPSTVIVWVTFIAVGSQTSTSESCVVEPQARYGEARRQLGAAAIGPGSGTAYGIWFEITSSRLPSRRSCALDAARPETERSRNSWARRPSTETASSVFPDDREDRGAVGLDDVGLVDALLLVVRRRVRRSWRRSRCRAAAPPQRRRRRRGRGGLRGDGRGRRGRPGDRRLRKPCVRARLAFA